MFEGARIRVRSYRFLVTAGAATLAALALGQQRQAESPKTVRFGDIVLRDFATAELELGVMARVSGPATTVDAVDPEQHATAQVRAREITAYLARAKGPKSPRRELGRVERIEAVGSVTFAGTRRAEGEPPVDVKASGSRAVYDRIAMQLTLEGPVTFSAEQPDPSGEGKDVVRGRARRAVYDENKRVLQLFGDVQATVVTPDTPAEGSSFSGDEVTIDMSKQPYRVSISNPSLAGSINIKVREPEKKPDQPGTGR